VGVTLIRFSEQNPYVGAGPVVGKILIVCPVSLVNVRISNIFDHHRPLMFSVVRTGRTSSGNGVLGCSIRMTVIPTYTSRLGRDRVGVFDGTKDKKTVKQFINS
jgi:DNA repair and recombination protein RAD54B